MNPDQPVPYSAEAACAACGKFGAFKFDGETLCADCYQGRGSCCAERDVSKPVKSD
jgi:hypothetical protein